MKKASFVLLVALMAVQARAQENFAILQGGYSTGWGNVSGTQPTGFKINVAWEFQPTGDRWTIGGSLGYLRLSGSESGSDYGLSTIPICAVSRIMFGSESFKFFVRGQLGTHISTVSYSGALVSLSDTQMGLAGGLGGGVMFFPSERMFLSADYEWLWLSNAFANTGSIGSAALGVGFRF
jgi:opacity protein-like surface antigen